MPKLIDLTGQKFGRLTVIKRAPNKGDIVQWECKCECGNQVIVRGECLRKGNTKSCGCLKKQIIYEQKCINLERQTFGDLTVLKKATQEEIFNNTNITTKDSSAYWWVQCNCGSLPFIVRGKDLRNGKTKSCGHLRQELSKDKINILTGQTFGLLTVVSFSGIKNHRAIWHCKCECGNEKDILGTLLSNNKVKSCGCIQSKGESKIVKILRDNQISFQQQKTFNNCISPISQSKLRFDFYVNNSYLIEYDGKQHFETNNSGWNTKQALKETQYRDNIKNQWCKENNIPLIRIPYTHYNDLCLEDLLLETSKFII